VEKYGTAGQATDDNIIRRMRTACWVTKATYTHSEYAILTSFPRQQWLRERALMLRLYGHCVSLFSVVMFYLAYTVLNAELQEVIHFGKPFDAIVHMFGVLRLIPSQRLFCSFFADCSCNFVGRTVAASCI
jgi:hypothetical protein